MMSTITQNLTLFEDIECDKNFQCNNKSYLTFSPSNKIVSLKKSVEKLNSKNSELNQALLIDQNSNYDKREKNQLNPNKDPKKESGNDKDPTSGPNKNKDQGPKSLFGHFSSKQCKVLACLASISLTAFSGTSLIAPFFPSEAAAKGLRETVFGTVFSAYSLVIMVASPLCGHFLTRVGAKRMLLAGVAISGSAIVAFGTITHVEHVAAFTVLCFAIRICEGLGAALMFTSQLTFVMKTFPDDIGLAFGLTETTAGVGMSLGPALGSVFYTLGGYSLPFYVLGSLHLFNLVICYRYIDSVSAKPNFKPPTQSFAKLLSVPKVAVVCLVVVTTSNLIGFLDPTIEPHLREINIRPEFVGLLFVLLSTTYTVFSPLVGWFAGKLNNMFGLMSFGLLLGCDGLLLLGPSSLVPLDASVSLIVFAMGLIGIAYSIAFIPTFECILDLATENGFEDNIGTYSLVSGLWSCMFSLGEVTGPTLGGWLTETYHFSEAVNIMALLTLIAAALVTVTFATPYGKSIAFNFNRITQSIRLYTRHWLVFRFLPNGRQRILNTPKVFVS